MSDRKLLVLGGTSGIGLTAYSRLMDSGHFTDGLAVGLETIDVNRTVDVIELIASTRPTDVVYSVGINRLDWIERVSRKDFHDVMGTNVWGFLKVVQSLHRIGSPWVNIIAVTSDAAWRPMRTSAIYCASKAALEMAVRVASREYAPIGWRINGVAPGKVENTPMTDYVDSRVLELRGWTQERAEAYEVGSTPLGRKVTKEEVASVIAHVMFGPKAQTGEIVAVNGGR